MGLLIFSELVGRFLKRIMWKQSVATDHFVKIRKSIIDLIRYSLSTDAFPLSFDNSTARDRAPSPRTSANRKAVYTVHEVNKNHVSHYMCIFPFRIREQAKLERI